MSFREAVERLLSSIPESPPEQVYLAPDISEDWIRANRGERYVKCRLNNFIATNHKQQEALDRVFNYGKAILFHRLPNDNIVLYGRPGTGKDHLLAALMRIAVQTNYHVRWHSGTELQSRLRSMFSGRNHDETEDGLAQKLVRCDVLAISDPIGPSTEGRAFYLEWLFRVIDERYSKRKPTWVTINALTSGEMEKMLTPQITRRLLEGAMAVAFDWEKWKGTT